MKCSIVFADGTNLNNVIFDNNIYVSPTAVTAEMLNDTALETVEITFEDGSSNVLKYAKTDIVYQESDGWHFVLVGSDEREISMKELRKENDMLTECILEMSEIVYGE